MPDEIEEEKNKYEGKYVCISKDCEFYNIGNSSFNIRKGQVHKHPGYDLEPGSFEVFDSEKDALAYIKKYGPWFEPTRGKQALSGKDGITKTFTPDEIPVKPSMDDVVKNAKSISNQGVVEKDKLTETDIDNLLDQNTRTVLSKIRKSEFPEKDLKRIAKVEKKGRGRDSLLKEIKKMSGG